MFDFVRNGWPKMCFPDNGQKRRRQMSLNPKCRYQTLSSSVCLFSVYTWLLWSSHFGLFEFALIVNSICLLETLNCCSNLHVWPLHPVICNRTAHKKIIRLLSLSSITTSGCFNVFLLFTMYPYLDLIQAYGIPYI